MNNVLVILNREEISCISGGVFCHAVVTVKNESMDISIFKKPTNGHCNVLPGILTGSLNISTRDYDVVCDCKNEYQEDSLIIQDSDGHPY